MIHIYNGFGCYTQCTTLASNSSHNFVLRIKEACAQGTRMNNYANSQGFLGTRITGSREGIQSFQSLPLLFHLYL